MNISTKKDNTTKDKNISIFSLKKDFKNPRYTFRAYTNRSTMQQKLFQIFLPQEAVAFGNNVEKKPIKATTKIEKICILYIHR